MPFPQAERIIYRKNPLEVVICQLRFPPILSIETEIPAKFQDLIRADYPLYNETTEFKINMPKESGDQIPSEILELKPTSTSTRNYEFISEDNNWKVNLTRNFLAVSTLQYTRWEDFKRHLIGPFEALIAIYSPAYFSRVGLRYKDVFKRSILGLDNTPWSELLQPYIIGIMTAKDVGNNVINFMFTTEIKLDDSASLVRIISGLGEDSNTGEIKYIIDSDFFTTDKKKRKEAIECLDYFNKRGSRLLRWCIKERLHEAMEPESL